MRCACEPRRALSHATCIQFRSTSRFGSRPPQGHGCQRGFSMLLCRRTRRFSQCSASLREHPTVTRTQPAAAAPPPAAVRHHRRALGGLDGAVEQPIDLARPRQRIGVDQILVRQTGRRLAEARAQQVAVSGGDVARQRGALALQRQHLALAGDHQRQPLCRMRLPQRPATAVAARVVPPQLQLLAVDVQPALAAAARLHRKQHTLPPYGRSAAPPAAPKHAGGRRRRARLICPGPCTAPSRSDRPASYAGCGAAPAARSAQRSLNRGLQCRQTHGWPRPVWMIWNGRLRRCLVVIRPALTNRLGFVWPRSQC